MAKRLRIGLNYFFSNETNSGIVNYIFNIISALNTLPDESKPEVVVFYAGDASIGYLKSIEYPYIKFLLFRPRPNLFFLRILNSILRRLVGRDPFRYFKYFRHIDCLYPYFEFKDRYFKDAPHKIHWLVDFNNKAFPHHYEDGGWKVSRSQQKITDSDESVVLSSVSLLNELKLYYPNYKCRVNILPFASSLPNLASDDISEVIRKYKIEVPYLMSPNQFWQHKNQEVVLKAIKEVKTAFPELKFKVLFSGSVSVNRGKGKYFDRLKEEIDEFDLWTHVEFLGVLDRYDQLHLMKGAAALIQPSLYEGWSTLVEEAKSLGKFIILSDIPVHREQISDGVAFFDPYDANSLAATIVEVLRRRPQTTAMDYQLNVEQFGKKIIDVFKRK